MTFRPLAHLDIQDGQASRRISLYHGDLTRIPPEHYVDLLVVSAFPNNYRPTASSLIGALDRAGLSIGDLSQDKLHDLRETCAFWLSQPLGQIGQSLNIGQIACFETTAGETPAALVGDLFRGLFPFLPHDREAVVAMPLLSTGDQNYSEAVMVEAILGGAKQWMSRGLPIKELKLVVFNSDLAESIAHSIVGRREQIPVLPLAPIEPAAGHKVFLSFSSKDQDAANAVKAALEARDDIGEIFDYRFSINKGECWQSEIDEAIQDARAVVPIITPDYLKSPECKEELLMARFRHKREETAVLYPVYWRQWEGDISLWLSIINSVDCRERDTKKLASSLANLAF